jgi:hypothetical protein
MKAVLLATVILLASVSTIKGDDKPDLEISTTAGFQNICRSLDETYSELNQDEKYHNVFCLAWMQGLFGGINVSEVIHKIPQNDRIACLPTGVDYHQLVHIVRKYITDHPELEHNPTEGLAVLALQDAFHCR